jgi:FG-GAP-like repeat
VSRVPSFAASKRYAVPLANGCGRCVESIAVGDLNGDGRPDLVTVNNDDTISVFITKLNGTFHARRDYIVGGDPAGAAIADLNGDGLADVEYRRLARARFARPVEDS